jgi:hypothetical protein
MCSGSHPPKAWLDFSDAAHPLERAHHAAVDRHRSSGEARAAAAGHDRNVVLVAPRHESDRLIGGARSHNGIGATLRPTPARRVVVVRGARRHIEHLLGADQPAELSRQPIKAHTC